MALKISHGRWGETTPDKIEDGFGNQFGEGEAFLLTVGAFLLTVKLLCLQSLKALIRYTFPL